MTWSRDMKKCHLFPDRLIVDTEIFVTETLSTYSILTGVVIYPGKCMQSHFFEVRNLANP